MDMQISILLYLFCLELRYTMISCREAARTKRQTDVSYGSPAYKHCECGRPNAKFEIPRIIGGREVMENEFPWMAAIILLNNLQLVCGGTIINDRYVLTAAHCLIFGYKKDTLKVIIGKHDLCKPDSRSVILSIEKLIPHPKYEEKTNAADIMLVKVVMKITFNEYIRPICLPKNGFIGSNVAVEFGGYSVSVLGWGYADISDQVCGLRATNLTLYKPAECPTTVSTLICAGYKLSARGTCSGDSGGPLQLLNKNGRFEQIGIVSSGIGCGDVTFPDFYTNVPQMISWIIKITSRDSMYCWR